MYGCLYTALTSEGALAEYRRYRAQAAATRQPDARDLVSIRVNRIGPVFDVTEADACAQVGVALDVLTGDEPDDVETCRTVADWARAQGYQGLLVPSAVLPRSKNLVIYIDGPAGNIDLEEGPDRRPI